MSLNREDRVASCHVVYILGLKGKDNIGFISSKIIEVTWGDEMNFSFYWRCKSSATCCRGPMLTDEDALFTICLISDKPRWFKKKGIDIISKEDGSTASSKDELKTLLL